ncbi:Hypothetical protein FKW44_010720, partial [Caligus rogercresseyi]
DIWLIVFTSYYSSDHESAEDELEEDEDVYEEYVDLGTTPLERGSLKTEMERQ